MKPHDNATPRPRSGYKRHADDNTTRAVDERLGRPNGPQTKGEWLLEQFYPDDPTFPLAAEIVASMPRYLTGRLPRRESELYGSPKPKAIPKAESKTEQPTARAGKEQAVPPPTGRSSPRPGQRAQRHALASPTRGLQDPKGPAAGDGAVATPEKAHDPEVPLQVKDCDCYSPGHQTHWIPAIRIYVATPCDPITVSAADDQGWVTFRDEGGHQFRWWHHDALRLTALWRAGASFSRVRGTQFLVARLPSGHRPWVYCADAPTPCVRLEDISDPITALKVAGGFTLDLSRGRRLSEPSPASNINCRRRDVAPGPRRRGNGSGVDEDGGDNGNG